MPNYSKYLTGGSLGSMHTLLFHTWSGYRIKEQSQGTGGSRMGLGGEPHRTRRYVAWIRQHRIPNRSLDLNRRIRLQL